MGITVQCSPGSRFEIVKEIDSLRSVDCIGHLTKCEVNPVFLYELCYLRWRSAARKPSSPYEDFDDISGFHPFGQPPVGLESGQVVSTPEPGAVALLGTALLGLGLSQLRRRSDPRA